MPNANNSRSTQYRVTLYQLFLLLLPAFFAIAKFIADAYELGGISGMLELTGVFVVTGWGALVFWKNGHGVWQFWVFRFDLATPVWRLGSQLPLVALYPLTRQVRRTWPLVRDPEMGLSTTLLVAAINPR